MTLNSNMQSSISCLLSRRRPMSTLAYFPILFICHYVCISNNYAHGSQIFDSEGINYHENRESLLHFIAIGDWGAALSKPHEIKRQRAVADGMASVFLQHAPKSLSTSTLIESSNESNSPFVISLGDNFYPSGLSGGEDEVASRFYQSFEEVYSHEVMKNVPWYVVAGNRDYEGDVDAQISYGQMSSIRWVFPDYFHRIVREISFPEDDDSDSGGGTVKVEIVLIDTTQLINESWDVIANKARSLSSGIDITSTNMDFTKNRGLMWIDHHLSHSDADYLLVVGHHPVHAAGYNVVVPGLEKLLQRYAVSAYASGHIHCMEHSTHGGIDYFISGTGMECSCEDFNGDDDSLGGHLKFLLRPGDNPTGAKGGFLSFDVGVEDMVVMFHDESGDVLYQTRIYPRL